MGKYKGEGDYMKNAKGSLAAFFPESDLYKDNKAVADKVIAGKDNRTLVYESVLESHTGDAYLVKAGQVIRMEQRHDETQVADWLFITPDLKEWSIMGTSTAFQGYYPELYHMLLSNTGNMRALATMVADELPDDFAPPGWSRHFWQWHCSPEIFGIIVPPPNDTPAGMHTCHTGFVHGLNRLPAIHAIEDEQERRQKVNELANNHNFQTFQLMEKYSDTDERGHTQTHMRLGVSKSLPHGTGVEFYANTDLYVVIAHCPGGNQSRSVWDGKTFQKVQPLYMSVWETGIEPAPRAKWKDWEGVFYDLVAKGARDISPRDSVESYKQKPTSGDSGDALLEYGAPHPESIMGKNVD